MREAQARPHALLGIELQQEQRVRPFEEVLVDPPVDLLVVVHTVLGEGYRRAELVVVESARGSRQPTLSWSRAPPRSDWHQLHRTTLAGGELRHAPDGWHGVVALAGVTHWLYFCQPYPPKHMPLSIELPLDANSGIRRQAAHRFWCAIEGVRPAISSSTFERRRRFVLMRALDVRLVDTVIGGNREGLFGRSASVAASWDRIDHLRKLTIRLVKNGIALMRGGYRALLRPPSRKKGQLLLFGIRQNTSDPSASPFEALLLIVAIVVPQSSCWRSRQQYVV